MLDNAVFAFSAQTVSTTEYSLTNNSTSIAAQTGAGVYSLFIDVANMVAGDQYEVKVYEKAAAGGTARATLLGVMTGAQPNPLNVVWGQLGIGWDFTLKRLAGAGADRAFSWSVRKVS